MQSRCKCAPGADEVVQRRSCRRVMKRFSRGSDVQQERWCRAEQVQRWCRDGAEAQVQLQLRRCRYH